VTHVNSEGRKLPCAAYRELLASGYGGLPDRASCQTVTPNQVSVSCFLQNLRSAPSGGGSSLGVNQRDGLDDVRVHLVTGPGLVMFSQRLDDLLMIVIALRHR
jgi:hypothetical protein